MAKRHKGQAEIERTALSQLKVEYVDINSLTPNEYNPNRQSDYEFGLLRRSIEEDGMTQPVIVQMDGKIVDGEHRWRACKELGHTEIPIVRVDMTEAQRRVATLRHNLARGSHDLDLESNVLRDLQKLGVLEWAQDALQLSDIEIDRMLNDVTPLDEYGIGEEFTSSWNYERAVPDSDQASSAGQLTVEQQRQLQQQGMRERDVELVNRGFTMTRAQEDVLRSATGDKPADTIMAMAEAHVEAKNRAGKGAWTSLTFLVPTETLLLIEQELDRLRAAAPNRNHDLTPELQRGLALEYMAVLSSQTPLESLD